MSEMPASVESTTEMDLTDLTQVIADRYGRVDILVHSAGAISPRAREEATVSEFDPLHRRRGPYLLTRKLLSLLMKPRGHVVFINSSVGLTAR